MEEMDEFTKYVEIFKKLPLQRKKEVLLDETKKTLAYSEFIKNSLNIENKILFNREILDYKNGNTSEDDLIEAIFVYTISIRENFAKTFNSIINSQKQ